MIAPAIERAPRMLLVIGKDEQGLPTETIIVEPSVSQMYASLRAWLEGVLPNWLQRALDGWRDHCGLARNRVTSSSLSLWFASSMTERPKRASPDRKK